MCVFRYQRMGESQSSDEDLSTNRRIEPENDHCRCHGRFLISRPQEGPTREQTISRDSRDQRKRMLTKEFEKKAEEVEMRPGNFSVGGSEDDSVFTEEKPVSSFYIPHNPIHAIICYYILT